MEQIYPVRAHGIEIGTLVIDSNSLAAAAAIYAGRTMTDGTTPDNDETQFVLLQLLAQQALHDWANRLQSGEVERALDAMETAVAVEFFGEREWPTLIAGRGPAILGAPQVRHWLSPKGDQAADLINRVAKALKTYSRVRRGRPTRGLADDQVSRAGSLWKAAHADALGARRASRVESDTPARYAHRIRMDLINKHLLHWSSENKARAANELSKLPPNLQADYIVRALTSIPATRLRRARRKKH